MAQGREVTPRQEVLTLLHRDAVLEPLLERFGPYRWALSAPLPALLRAIVGQRISSQAAKAVYARLRDHTALDPTALLRTPVTELRALGLSEGKARAVHALAHAAAAGTLERLDELSNAEVMARLMALYGVGPWSAQMVLIFSLGRLDVWPTGDLGVVKAARALYGVTTAAEIAALGARFAPYQSAAVWYLWRFVTAEAGRPNGSSQPR